MGAIYVYKLSVGYDTLQAILDRLSELFPDEDLSLHEVSEHHYNNAVSGEPYGMAVLVTGDQTVFEEMTDAKRPVIYFENPWTLVEEAIPDDTVIALNGGMSPAG